jgi:hypothetical protein
MIVSQQVGDMPDNEKKLGIESVGKIATLAASLSLPASVIFDWGYFQALNIPMREVPSSLIDHAKSAVYWFPLALFVACGWMAFHIFLVRFTANTILNRPRPRTVLEIKDFRAVEPRLTFIARVALSFGGLLAVGAALAYVLFGDVLFPLAIFGFSLIWVSVIMWMLMHPSVITRWSVEIVFVMMFAPSAAFSLWGIGYNFGLYANFATPNTEITLAGQSAVQPVFVIRYFDKGVLVRTRSDGVEFFQWSNIAAINSSHRHKENQGLLCSYLKRCGVIGTVRERYASQD